MVERSEKVPHRLISWAGPQPKTLQALEVKQENGQPLNAGNTSSLYQFQSSDKTYDFHMRWVLGSGSRIPPPVRPDHVPHMSMAPC